MFQIVPYFRGGNTTPDTRQGWQAATPAPMVAPPNFQQFTFELYIIYVSMVVNFRDITIVYRLVFVKHLAHNLT